MGISSILFTSFESSMNFTLSLDIPRLPAPISYQDGILLIGSCFTEHMAERLVQHRFRTLSNPNGILFNPLSVADAIDSYLDEREYGADDLFFLNEVWNSWDHHSRFSHPDKETALQGINASQREAGAFIREANWIIVTLGTGFQYFLKTEDRPVSNNHRAPAQWFEKRLLEIDWMVEAWTATLERLFSLNPNANVLFTISPVRHIRDGVVDNNRSKARLMEAVHRLCSDFDRAHYFPAYELVIDILRDYRFYDIDMVHPNYLATSFVWEEFVKSCVDAAALPVMERMRDIATARSHRPRFPDTAAHQAFKVAYAQKVRQLLEQEPYLDLKEELQFFES